MSDLKHEADRKSHSPGSLTELFLTELNPVAQWNVAKEIARDPGYLKNHPQDILLPLTLVGLPAAHGYTSGFDAGRDINKAFMNKYQGIKAGFDVLSDLAHLRLGDAFKDEFKMIGYNAAAWYYLGKAPIDLVKQPFQHSFEAGKDLASTPLNMLKDNVSGIKHELNVAKEGTLAAKDVVTLNPKGAVIHSADMVKEQALALKDSVKLTAEPVIGVGKAVLDLF